MGQGTEIIGTFPHLLKQHKDKIIAMQNNLYFNNAYTNQIGLEFCKYLLHRKYYTLMNDDPVSPEANTLSKELNYAKIFDEYFQKPLNEINHNDVSRFMEVFESGELTKKKVFLKYENGVRKAVVKETTSKRSLTNYKRIIHTLKRMLRIMREYERNTNQQYDPEKYEWISHIKARKLKQTYPNFPWYDLGDLIALADNMNKNEYTARVVVTLNLMGRVCELSHLKYKDIEWRDNGTKLWILLPNVKKFSTGKVHVQLYDYAKSRLVKYLKTKEWNPEDLVFPRKDTAFAKHIGKISTELFGPSKRITPKILRKLGVCVARQLKIPMDECCQVGGWALNSPAIEHYYKRMGVEAKADVNGRAQQLQYKDVYAEIDKQKQEMDNMRKLIVQMTEKMEQMDVAQNKTSVVQLLQAIGSGKEDGNIAR